jgi:hypothetical protein
MPGVRGVYDRYEYLEEKRDAFNRLAALIMEIINPTQRSPNENVLARTHSRRDGQDRS